MRGRSWISLDLNLKKVQIQTSYKLAKLFLFLFFKLQINGCHEQPLIYLCAACSLWHYFCPLRKASLIILQKENLKIF